MAGFLLASGQGGDHSSSPGCGAGPEGAGHQHHPGLVHLLESPSMLLKMLPPDLLRPTKTYSPGPGPKRPNLHQGLQKSLTLPVAELPTGVPIFGALSLWFMVRGQGPGAGAGGGRAHSRPNCGSPAEALGPICPIRNRPPPSAPPQASLARPPAPEACTFADWACSVQSGEGTPSSPNQSAPRGWIRLLPRAVVQFTVWWGNARAHH